MPASQTFFDSSKGDVVFPGVTSAKTVDPTLSNDGTQGFVPGSLWLNTTNLRVWACVSNATGAAAWAIVGTVPGSGTEPANTQTQFGGGTASFYGEGNILRQTSGAGLSPGATGADNVIAVYSLPAGSFDIAGRGLNFIAQGSFANNTNTKRTKIYFNATTAVVGSTVTGGTVVADSATYSTTGAVGWSIEANVFKYGAAGSNTQLGLHQSAQVGAVVGSLLVPTLITATESGAILIAVTGNAGTTAADILLNLFEINAMN